MFNSSTWIWASGLKVQVPGLDACFRPCRGRKALAERLSREMVYSIRASVQTVGPSPSLSWRCPRFRAAICNVGRRSSCMGQQATGIGALHVGLQVLPKNLELGLGFVRKHSGSKHAWPTCARPVYARSR